MRHISRLHRNSARGHYRKNAKLIHPLHNFNPSLASYLFTFDLSANLLSRYQTPAILFYRSLIETLEILTIKFHWPQQQEGNTNTQHLSRGARGTQQRSNSIGTRATRSNHHRQGTVPRRTEVGQFNPQAAKFCCNPATSTV